MINIKYQMWPVFCGAVDIDAEHPTRLGLATDTRWTIDVILSSSEQCVVKLCGKEDNSTDSFIDIETKIWAEQSPGRFVSKRYVVELRSFYSPFIHPPTIAFTASVVRRSLCGKRLTLPRNEIFGEVSGCSVVVTEDFMDKTVEVECTKDGKKITGSLVRGVVEELS